MAFLQVMFSLLFGVISCIPFNYLYYGEEEGSIEISYEAEIREYSKKYKDIELYQKMCSDSLEILSACTCEFKPKASGSLFLSDYIGNYDIMYIGCRPTTVELSNLNNKLLGFDFPK
ncbi:hypothetical protein GPJ56_002676 [Histomonas meleagridis]|nr:hypothetical protein GPJ56_002676 [Histomonas meleagridis]